MSMRDESSIWSTWLEQLAFLNLLEDKILRMHVGFGFYLGAPIASDIWNANMVREMYPGANVIRERIINDQKRLTKSITGPNQIFLRPIFQYWMQTINTLIQMSSERRQT